MEVLTVTELKALAAQKQQPSISFFMPTHRTGRDTQQDPIRFRNLLRDAENRLLESGMRRPDMLALLQPAQTLLDDSPFWQHQQDGLAVYLSQGDFHVYRLPITVEEQLVIDNTYYFKPILPLFTNNGHYYILALSQNEIRLYEGTRHSAGEIDLPAGVPTSLDEALPLEDREQNVSVRNVTGQGGMFFGQSDEVHKERVARYLNRVDAALKPWYNQVSAPVVLAGVEYLLPIYRRESEYANILPHGITGNPETLRPEELQAQAWPIVEPYFQQELDAVIGEYRQLVGTGTASHQLSEAIPAAYFGRVDKMIVAVDSQVWGEFDADSGSVVQHSEEQKTESDIALLDAAAMHTIFNGGKIYAVAQADMPVDSPVVAVFRY